MKYNLSNVTVLIPVRIDSVIRLENLLAVVDYLLKNFEINIIVSEAAPYNNKVLQQLLPKSIIYNFTKDRDPVYYRTKYINQMVSHVITNIVAIWDADVLFPIRQIVESVDLLNKGVYDAVYPYDGSFYDTSMIIRQMYMETPDVELLEKESSMMQLLYGKESYGGAFFINTNKYKGAGMENLNFYGWGSEDWERYDRWMNLGYNIGRVSGNLYHLSHPRDMNGKYNSLLQRRCSTQERFISKFSSSSEIIARMKRS